MQDYLGYLKLARSLASNSGLTLELGEPTQCPMTDGRKLLVPRPDPLWNADQWHNWNDGVWHEIGHNMPECRDVFKMVEKEKVDMRSLFGAVLNLTDDFRVDRIRCDKYYGMREANNVCMPKHIEGMAKHDYNFDKEPGHRVILTMLAFDAAQRGVDNPRLRGYDALLTSKLDAKGLGWLEKLTSKYSERYRKHEHGKDELQWCREVFKDVFELDSKESGDGTADQPESGGEEGEPGEGNGQGAESEGNPAEGTGKDSKKPSKRGAVMSYEEMLKHPHSDDPRDAKGNPIRIEYERNASTRRYQPHTDVTNKYFDFAGGFRFQKGERSYGHVSESGVHRVTEQLNIDAIIGQARRLLQAETRKRPLMNQKKGRLDPTKIYRVTMPESSVSEKLFRSKAQNHSLDTAVSVLVDYSGSMCYGGKMTKAIAAALAFEQLFKTLRVSCEILGFTEHTRAANYTYVFKPFNQNVRDSDLLEGMVNATDTMANNCDGDSILIAYDRLTKQRNPRKVLLVLSDGSPAGGNGDIDGFTKKVIKKIEEERIVDIIGIGIEDTNVERLYKTHRVVQNAADLPSKLIETLEDVILERKIK